MKKNIMTVFAAIGLFGGLIIGSIAFAGPIPSPFPRPTLPPLADKYTVIVKMADYGQVKTPPRPEKIRISIQGDPRFIGEDEGQYFYAKVTGKNVESISIDQALLKKIHKGRDGYRFYPEGIFLDKEGKETTRVYIKNLSGKVVQEIYWYGPAKYLNYPGTINLDVLPHNIYPFD